ncbi:MAG: hypothetical protein LPK03_04145, partial [Pontibacter sp.]|nr:hypothetical protein [Pontibacter sp.]
HVGHAYLGCNRLCCLVYTMQCNVRMLVDDARGYVLASSVNNLSAILSQVFAYLGNLAILD